MDLHHKVLILLFFSFNIKLSLTLVPFELMERLDKIDLNILIERNERREDTRNLHSVIMRLEKRLNGSRGNLDAGSGGILVSDVEQIKKIVARFDLQEISNRIDMLKYALQSEKKENVRSRRRLTEVQNISQNCNANFQKLSGDIFSILNVLRNVTDKINEMEKQLNSLVIKHDLLLYSFDKFQNVTSTVPLTFVQEQCNLTRPATDVLSIKQSQREVVQPKSCLEALRMGSTSSGVYDVDLAEHSIQVYCDQETDGGGWIVFQRRRDGTIDFYRNWQEYKFGFGNPNGEFWIGNDNLHRLLSTGKQHELRVDLQDFDNVNAHAKYSRFMVGPESCNYMLTVMGYSGNAGDGMNYHNGQQFSTKDRDNDRYEENSCSKEYKGGWWYNSCHHVNLNGPYSFDKNREDRSNIRWWEWRFSYPLKIVEMKFR